MTHKKQPTEKKSGSFGGLYQPSDGRDLTPEEQQAISAATEVPVNTAPSTALAAKTAPRAAGEVMAPEDCPPGIICARPGATLCGPSLVCLPDQKCVGGYSCCPIESAVCDGVCCKIGDSCILGQCAAPGSQACGRTVCSPGVQCHQSIRAVTESNSLNTSAAVQKFMVCCSSERQVCGNACCKQNEQCILDKCMPPGSSRCGTASACLPRQLCFNANSTGTCCNMSETFCGTGSTGSCCDGTCINNQCAPRGSVECGASYCTSGQSCLGTGASAVCCRAGSQACGRTCCPYSQLCSGGVCYAQGSSSCGSLVSATSIDAQLS
jgi:hypothetical protein